MEKVSRSLENQRKFAFDNLKDGKCLVFQQNDRTGEIKKLKGDVVTLSSGQKVIYGIFHYDTDGYTTLMYK